VDLLKTLPEKELIKIIGDYDGLVVRSATKVYSIMSYCLSYNNSNNIIITVIIFFFFCKDTIIIIYILINAGYTKRNKPC
jgi:hypothetical protein